jgi:hypothetical protein
MPCFYISGTAMEGNCKIGGQHWSLCEEEHSSEWSSSTLEIGYHPIKLDSY